METFNFLEEIENSYEQDNGKAPAPENEMPEVDADDFDDIPEGEKEKIRDNATTEHGQQQQASETTIKATARLIVSIAEMANKSICSGISKMDRENYKFSGSEKNDLTEATGEYLKTVEKPLMTPGEMLFATFATVIGGNVIMAFEHKEKKQKTDRENEAVRRARSARTAEESRAAKEDLDEIRREKAETVVEEPPQRQQFQVDKNGFYLYDEGGNYLKGKAKTEKAPAEILRILDEAKKSGMTGSEANEAVRRFLYGSS